MASAWSCVRITPLNDRTPNGPSTRNETSRKLFPQSMMMLVISPLVSRRCSKSCGLDRKFFEPGFMASTHCAQGKPDKTQLSIGVQELDPAPTMTILSTASILIVDFFALLGREETIETGGSVVGVRTPTCIHKQYAESWSFNQDVASNLHVVSAQRRPTHFRSDNVGDVARITACIDSCLLLDTATRRNVVNVAEQQSNSAVPPTVYHEKKRSLVCPGL